MFFSKSKHRIHIEVQPVPGLERSFRETVQGWRGSDCAFSLPLGNERALWLFGDTFIQNNPAKKSRHGTQIINNSIAIQHGDLLEDEQPLSFHWKHGSESFFTNEKLPGFLWPLSAAQVDGKLYVFNVRIIHPHPEKVFGFQLIGNEIIRIENPGETPDHWIQHDFALPWKKEIGTFGSYVYAQDHHLYIYGFQKKRKTWIKHLKLLVARVDLNEHRDIQDMNQWWFFDASTARWSRDIHLMKPVLNHATTELSVSYSPYLNKYIMISHWIRSRGDIIIRFSDTPYGPFSEPRLIYSCPEKKWDRQYFCYAAKAHPELSLREDELIITYMTNSKSLSKCIDDLRIYYPRFLRITLH